MENLEQLVESPNPPPPPAGVPVTKKNMWSRAASNFIALIPSRSIRQIIANFLELNSKGLYRSSRLEEESRCLVFTKLGTFTTQSTVTVTKLQLAWYTSRAIILLIRYGLFFFWSGQMRNIEKDCLQGLKRPDILFANVIMSKITLPKLK